MTLVQNILHGAGTVLELCPQTTKRQNKFFVKRMSDAQAIASDFEAVGQDIWKVLDDQKETQENA